jgi:hypothetical protein
VTNEIDELRIGYSKWRLGGLAMSSALMSALCAAVAFHALPDIEPGGREEFIGYVGAVFFALGAGISLRRLATEKSAVIILTPRGLTDRRLSAQPIPWTSIRNIRVHAIRQQKFIALSVDPQAEAALAQTGLAKWARAANRWAGVDGLCVIAAGLTIGHDALLDAIVKRWTAAKRAGETSSP